MRSGSNAIHFDQVARHIEIHDIAAIIAVEPQDAGAGVGRANGDCHLVGGRRGEYIANRAGIEQTIADIDGKDRQVVGTASVTTPTLPE